MRRRSIAPTYDSRDTGERWHVTTSIRGRVLAWRAPLPDPFVRVVVNVGLWDILRGFLPALFRFRRFTVEVIVGADRDLMHDVLELDANVLIPHSTRWAEHHAYMADAARFAATPVDPRHEPQEGQEL